MILECVRMGLRGELTRWLYEVKAGVFVGRVSALVRDELWALVESKLGSGSAILLFTDQNEQGFGARLLGNPSRELVDIEGLLLVRT